MSAFMVGKTHIDALITAGLAKRPGDSPLRWLWPWPTLEELRGARVPGVAISSGDVALAQDRIKVLTRETAGWVGAMLMAENRRSVDFRYAEEEIEEAYEFTPLGQQIDPLVVFKAISCYEYQSCEHPEWELSEARAFCESLRHEMISRLPGYDAVDGAWEIRDPLIFGPPLRRLV